MIRAARIRYGYVSISGSLSVACDVVFTFEIVVSCGFVFVLSCLCSRLFWHERGSICFNAAFLQAKCDREFKTCMDAVCATQKDKKRCTETGDSFYMMTTMLGCGPFMASQRNACLCVDKEL